MGHEPIHLSQEGLILTFCDLAEVGFFADRPRVTYSDLAEVGFFTDRPGLTYCDLAEVGLIEYRPGLTYCDLAEVGFFTDRLGLTYCDLAEVTFPGNMSCLHFHIPTNPAGFLYPQIITNMNNSGSFVGPMFFLLPPR